jgi:bifunctional non-homologous end joining protein LigD
MPTDAVLAPPLGLATALPHAEPVRLVPREAPFDDPAWVFEPKYDGVRALLYASYDGCEIDITREVRHLVQDLRSRVTEVLEGREAILDGEIVALDRRGKPVLQHLLQGEGYLAFAASDILWLNGADLRDRPLKQRKERLGELLPEDTGPLYKVLTIEEHGRALFGAIKRLDLGGIVAKCQNDPYHPSTVWYEIRNPGRPSPSEDWGEVFRQRARPRNPNPPTVTARH